MDIIDLAEHSYVPYSGTSSVAVIRSIEGRYFPGVRVENISYPLSISAEQNALFCCLSEGDYPETLWTTEIGEPLISYWKEELDITTRPLDNIDQNSVQFADLKLNSDIDPETKLTELLDQAIVGESNFPVTALLEASDGFFSGVNIEVSAWGMGLCAERLAIAKAFSYGYDKLLGLHIHTRDGEFSSPCGACRQVILEHLPNRQIHLHHSDYSESIHFSKDLLPHSFQSSSLYK